MTQETHAFNRRRIGELLHALRESLTAAEIDGVKDLVESGDLADAVRTLAWIMDEKKAEVNESTLRHICAVSSGIADPRDMPPRFRAVLMETTVSFPALAQRKPEKM